MMTTICRKALHAFALLLICLGLGATAAVAAAGPMQVDIAPSPPGIIDDDGFVNYDFSSHPKPATWPKPPTRRAPTWPKAPSSPGECALEAVHCDRPE